LDHAHRGPAGNILNRVRVFLGSYAERLYLVRDNRTRGLAETAKVTHRGGLVVANGKSAFLAEAH